MSNDSRVVRARRDALKGLVGAVAVAAAPAGAAHTAATHASHVAAPSIEEADLAYDVVVVGAGAAGLVAALRAAEQGASVLVVDANYDIGGHAILSGGNVTLGGGTALQKKYGIADDAEQVFRDLTDWTVVERNGMPEYRYNDRALQRALADNMVDTFNFLVAHQVPFVDAAPDNAGGHSIGISARRQHHCVWDRGQSAESPAGAGGTGLMRALERSARRTGIAFLLNYHMDALLRADGTSGRVCGVVAHYAPTLLPGHAQPLSSYASAGNIALTQASVRVHARTSVVLCTGGHSANVNFRRMFDSRLTEEYATAGEEYSPQDASGELAALAIGASLWGTANQSTERNGAVRKRPLIGTRSNYIRWTPDSPIFPKVRATGLRVRDFGNVVIVNQAGERFYDELEDGYPNGSTEGFYEDGYRQGDWRNATRVPYRPANYVDAALAINAASVAPDFSAGPQWAIFDEGARRREGWETAPPHVDPRYFFSADSIDALASKINTCRYQKVPMSPEALRATIAGFNRAVDAGQDSAFGRTALRHRFDAPPFYAAWSSVVVHDAYAGLRVNARCEVVDWQGAAIPGLYCAGETAGGSSQHGLGRCLTQGFIAGRLAAQAEVQR
ncbi:MAG: FAD-dependent oxidoreductase [Pseudoxanthomonas sp.]